MRKVIFIFIALILVLDLFTPLGIATPMLYVIPIFLAGLLLSYEHAFYVTIAATVMTYIGYAWIWKEGDPATGEMNRLLSTVLIWAIFLVARFLHHIREEMSTFYEQHKH